MISLSSSDPQLHKPPGSGSSSDSDSSSASDPAITSPSCGPHKPLASLEGHEGSVTCLALCGEFVLSASRGRDIIVWQLPDLRQLTRFGHSDSNGFVKSLVAVGTRIFSAHQDSRIRVWKLSRNPENIFKLVATLPTTKDYLGNCMKQSNYVQTRRHHRKLWIEHADSISCLAVDNGLIYSGSWDKYIKVWSIADLRCLQSIKAHDDAVNALVAHKGMVYSASADGKIRIWGQRWDDVSTAVPSPSPYSHCLKASFEGHRDVCWNAVVVCDDGRTVYGGGSDGRVMGWSRDDKEGWRPMCDLRAHDKSVLCLCSTRDGRFVCSGSADKTIGVWRREGEGRLTRMGMITGHEAPVKCLQASDAGVGEGFMLYSGGIDKRLRVWWVPKEYGKVEHGEELEMKKCVLLR